MLGQVFRLYKMHLTPIPTLCYTKPWPQKYHPIVQLLMTMGSGIAMLIRAERFTPSTTPHYPINYFRTENVKRPMTVCSCIIHGAVAAIE